MKDIPAFPSKQKALMIKSEHIDIASEYEIEHNGMTLRDYFAAKAMEKLMGKMYDSILEVLKQSYEDDAAKEMSKIMVADTTYEWADAMMKARGA
jgi:hypothetical protein